MTIIKGSMGTTLRVANAYRHIWNEAHYRISEGQARKIQPGETFGGPTGPRKLWVSDDSSACPCGRCNDGARRVA